MNEVLNLILVLLIGLLLGIVFYGGLWLTVKMTLNKPNPGLWLLLSFVLRMAVVLVGLYAISGKDWKAMLVGLFGVIIARPIVQRFTKKKDMGTKTKNSQ